MPPNCFHSGPFTASIVAHEERFVLSYNALRNNKQSPFCVCHRLVFGDDGVCFPVSFR